MGLGRESLADVLPAWFGAKRTGETLGCRNRVPKHWPGDPIASVLGLFIIMCYNIYIVT